MILRVAVVAALLIVAGSTSGPEDDPAVRSATTLTSWRLSPTPLDLRPEDPPATVRRAAGSRASGLGERLLAAERRLDAYAQTMRRQRQWFTCTRPLGVDQAGDRQHRWGFEYDERDGSGIDTRPALVVHRGAGPADLFLLRRSRAAGCLSRAPDPNGTGADARATPVEVAGSGRQTAREARLRELKRRLARLRRGIAGVERGTERFDAWESCLVWLPVTERGHADQDLGFLFDGPRVDRAEPPAHVGAVSIDTSGRDDPDYELLALLGPDPRGSSECDHDPGEGVDRGPAPREPTRTARARGPLRELRRALSAAEEDLADLAEPVQEFVRFDECMYTVGMRSRGSGTGGYRFVGADGTRRHRAALSFDLRGLRLPQMDVMAFSGEEPPQIECNEDASGADTDE